MGYCLLALLILLIAALLGYLLARNWWKSGYDELNLNLTGERGRYKKLEGEYSTSVSYGKKLEGEKKGLLGERDRLNDDILNLKSSVSRYDGEISQLKEERTGLNASLQDWQAKYRSIEGSLQEKTTAFNRAESERTGLATRVDELEGKLSRKDTEAKEAAQRASSLKVDFDRVLGERQTFATQLDHFKTTQGGKVGELETANAGLLEERNSLAAKLETLSSENGNAILENNNLTAQINNLTANLDGVRRSKEDLEYKFLSLEREHDQLKAQQTEQSAGLTTEVDRLKGLLSERATEIETLNSSISDRANDKNQLVAEAASLRTEMRELEAKIESLNNEKSGLASAHSDEVERLNAALNNGKGELERLRTANADLETKVEVASQKPDESIELKALRSNYSGSKEEVARLRSQLATRRDQASEVARLNAELSSRPMAVAAPDNSAELEELRAKNAELQSELEPFRAAIEKKKANAEGAERKRREVLERIRGRQDQVAWDRIGRSTLEDKDNLKRLRALGGFVQEKFNALGIYKFEQVAKFMKQDEAQINELLELPKQKIQKEDWVVEARRQLGLEVDNDPGATLARVAGKQKKVNFDRIGVASAANKDDLQRISDVSAFDEAKLNALGLYRFAQIANFSKKDTEIVNEAIEVFDGRIATEEWVNQAKQLEASSLEEVLARVRERSSSMDFSRIGAANGKDNLQAINGIGPFIEAKLNALGVETFAQIARFNDTDEVAVNEAIELNAGHIQSDEWVKQAQGMS